MKDAPHRIHLVSRFHPFRFYFRGSQYSSSCIQDGFTRLYFHAAQIDVDIGMPLCVQPAGESGIITAVVPFIVRNKPESLLFGQAADGGVGWSSCNKSPIWSVFFNKK